MEPQILVSLISDLGALGFILWLAHRLTAKTIPDMTNAFIASNEKQREDFKETLEKQRADFRAFHEQEHQSHESRLQKVMDKCITSADRGDT